MIKQDHNKLAVTCAGLDRCEEDFKEAGKFVLGCLGNIN